MSKLTKLIKHPIKFFQDIGKRDELGSALIYQRTANSIAEIKHLIHTGENLESGISHLTQWIPYFKNAQITFAILVRNIALFEWLKKNEPNIVTIYAKTATDFEKITEKLVKLKNIYYLSNTGNLIHSLRFNEYQHIFLGHGDSEKSASAHKFFRVYDQIWVAGQAHIDRFNNANFQTKHLEFVKVGRPTLKSILNLDNTSIPPSILYLPTWEGVYEKNNYSSLNIAVEMLKEIARKIPLPIATKLHPATGTRNKQYSEQFKNMPIFTKYKSNTTLQSLISEHSIYICDISAVVSECLVTGNPLFVYIPEGKNSDIAKSNMEYNNYAYTFSNISQLIEQLGLVLNGYDPKKQARQQAIDYFIGLNETKNDEFIKRLQYLD